MKILIAISRILLVVIVVFQLAECTRAVAQAGYREASVCGLLVDKRINSPKRVSIEAGLVVARPHGVVLIDQHCPEKPLALEFPSKGGDESVTELEAAIRNGEISEGATGKFLGTIRLNPKTMKPVLLLRLVKNLHPKIGAATTPGFALPKMIGQRRPSLPDSDVRVYAYDLEAHRHDVS